MRILNGDAVRLALPMTSAIDAAKVAYTAHATGNGVAPQRVALDLGPGDVALFMPGLLPDMLVVKAVTVLPGNPARGLPTNQGALLAIDPSTGVARGLLDTATVTQLRTAAGAAAATDCLARADATSLAILGTGALAIPHIEAISAVRPIAAVHIWGRTAEHVVALVDRLFKTRVCAGENAVDVTVHGTADLAVAAADVVCTLTQSETPLFSGDAVRPGTHINAVGAFRPVMCELPATTLARARVFVDDLEAATQEAGDIIQAVEAGTMTWDDVVGEVGAVLDGNVAGRSSDDDVTVFKSVGMSLQDAAAAASALSVAERDDLGIVVDWP